MKLTYQGEETEAAPSTVAEFLQAEDNMSAGSRVTPGGYASARKTETAQFTLADARFPAEVFAAIRANGQEAVFKTWDNRI